MTDGGGVGSKKSPNFCDVIDGRPPTDEKEHDI